MPPPVVIEMTPSLTTFAARIEFALTLVFNTAPSIIFKTSDWIYDFISTSPRILTSPPIISRPEFIVPPLRLIVPLFCMLADQLRKPALSVETEAPSAIDHLPEMFASILTSPVTFVCALMPFWVTVPPVRISVALLFCVVTLLDRSLSAFVVRVPPSLILMLEDNTALFITSPIILREPSPSPQVDIS